MLHRHPLIRVSVMSGVCCAAASADGTTSPGSIVTSALPQTVSPATEPPRLFALTGPTTGKAGWRDDLGCDNSDGCFPLRGRPARGDVASEPPPPDSLRLGEYGPVSLKFTGTRVKMRLRF